MPLSQTAGRSNPPPAGPYLWPTCEQRRQQGLLLCMFCSGGCGLPPLASAWASRQGRLARLLTRQHMHAPAGPFNPRPGVLSCLLSHACPAHPHPCRPPSSSHDRKPWDPPCSCPAGRTSRLGQPPLGCCAGRGGCCSQAASCSCTDPSGEFVTVNAAVDRVLERLHYSFSWQHAWGRPVHPPLVGAGCRCSFMLVPAPTPSFQHRRQAYHREQRSL